MGSVMLLAVADVLTDAASVLGGDATLQILYMKLVEACIICFDCNINYLHEVCLFSSRLQEPGSR